MVDSGGSAIAVPEGWTPARRPGKIVAPGSYGPNRQHFFNFWPDMGIDSANNCVYEVDSIPEPDAELNPHRTVSITRDTLVAAEADGARDWNWSTGRYWKVTNPGPGAGPAAVTPKACHAGQGGLSVAERARES